MAQHWVDALGHHPSVHSTKQPNILQLAKHPASVMEHDAVFVGDHITNNCVLLLNSLLHSGCTLTHP